MIPKSLGKDTEMRADHHPRALLGRSVIAGAAAALILAGGAVADALPLPTATVPVGTLPTATVPVGTLPTSPITTPVVSVVTTIAPPQSAAAAARAASAHAMVGTFKLATATCSGSVKGSYFRMIQPGGSATGPFVSNSDSPCSDRSYTPMSAGTDGGLKTGTYQPEPSPAFAGGNGLANRITKPQKFFGADFASASNPTDPQTGTKVTEPTILVDDAGHLSGDLRAFAASWNGQHFNQGAPKPDGTTPGLTTALTGTYNATTKAFVLDWTSRIVGGPFNSFTGKWHFEGTFEGTTSTQPTTLAAVLGGSAGSGGSAAAAGSGATAGTHGKLANTGLSVATDRGLWLLAAGMFGFGLLGRTRRCLPRAGVPPRG